MTLQPLISLLVGWLLDLLLGDPRWLPHPIVGFGKTIAFGEHRLNKGNHRMLKGALMAVCLIALTFLITWFLRLQLGKMHDALCIVFDALIVFFCLAGTSLIREVRAVFLALDRSLDEGRRQVARIVGRDTTLDSMIGYKTDRYRLFGCWAAHIDDVANYIPARLTALLMVLVAGKPFLIQFVWRNGKNHASPNSGYPEAALAGILNCRFGGPHFYFGQLFPKPYIGENDRPLTTRDLKTAIRVNHAAEVIMVLLVVFRYLI